MKIQPGKFVLISCTEHPLEALYAVWAISRPTQHKELLDYCEKQYGTRLPTAHMLYEIQHNIELAISNDWGPPPNKNELMALKPHFSEERMLEVFKLVVAMAIPVSESIHFTWGFEGMPIAWREQAVRERQWGFWLTSMREFDMSSFVDEGRVFFPERYEDVMTEIDEHRVGSTYCDSGDTLTQEHEAAQFLEDAFVQIQNIYNKLLEKGMTQEEARNVIPLAAKHNGTMFSNLRTLLTTMSKRSCWIAQVELWGPVIKGVAEELRKKHSALGMMISPPCMKPYSDKFHGCKFEGIMQNRMSGKDPYAVCPLYIHHGGASNPVHSVAVPSEFIHLKYEKHLEELTQSGRSAYARLAKRHLTIWQDVWNRDVYDGHILKDGK